MSTQTEDVPRQATAEGVWVALARGETLLVVPVRSGVAELSRVSALRGASRTLFEELLDEPSLGRARQLLEARGATPEAAERDAERFLEGLAHGELGREAGGAPPQPAGFVASADDLLALARAVLAAGHTLRFQARGRSMRPFLPHGSHLDVVPRPFDAIARGAVVLYGGDEERLVAHRVVAREGGHLIARGDSSPRRERVTQEAYLGLVRTARRPGEEHLVLVSEGPRRVLGLVLGALYAAASAAARALVIRPLRGSFDGPSRVRSGLRGLLRVACGSLVRLERLARRARAPLDALRAALTSTREKDEQRRALYEKRTVQRFTALDENLASGLTLIEEVLLARHSIAPCRALVLGCGPGRECFALARRGFQVTGLDREPGMLADARSLAARQALEVRFVEGEAHDFHVEGPPFELVVVFSGLYDMLLPRTRRLALLRSAARHLVPGGRLALTFLSAYQRPGLPPRPRVRTFLEALNPEHEDGDLFLLNENVHVFPRGSDVAEEAREAGFEVVALERDQRAYDRFEGRVKGYALLSVPPE